MADKKDKIDPIDATFDEVVGAISPRVYGKEITSMDRKINKLAPVRRRKKITSDQGTFDLGIDIERDIEGIGMGVLSDGTPYLNQRGLAALCGVQNAHIGTISSQWKESVQKPRISTIKGILLEAGADFAQPHIEVPHKGVVHFCYPAEICLAVLEYYALDAGSNVRPEARKNFRLLAGSKLKEMIYSQVGYDPTGGIAEPLRKWHERIELNHQSAPSGYFSIFNEAHTVIYELIMAGAEIGEKMVPDISATKQSQSPSPSTSEKTTSEMVLLDSPKSWSRCTSQLSSPSCSAQ